MTRYSLIYNLFLWRRENWLLSTYRKRWSFEEREKVVIVVLVVVVLVEEEGLEGGYHLAVWCRE